MSAKENISYIITSFNKSKAKERNVTKRALMSKRTIFLMYAFTLGCSPKVCSPNTSENVKTFKTHLENMSRYEEGKSAILVEVYRDAIFYLSAVSGIMSTACYSGEASCLIK